MKRLLITLLVAWFLPVAATAHEIRVGTLVIVNPMVDEAAKGQAYAQGSVKIKNEGKSPDQLMAMSAEFAETALINTPVLVPATGQAITVPITFEKIKRQLSEAEAYAGELVFKRAGKIKIDLFVHHQAY
jgi:copper(I)-binding protein